MLTILNMAPGAGTIKSTKAIVFRLEHATVDCMKFETYFRARNILLDKDKMDFLLFNSDEKTLDILINNEEIFFKITWRQFKGRIKKYVEGKALENILALRQKELEKTSIWLKRVILIEYVNR